MQAAWRLCFIIKQRSSISYTKITLLKEFSAEGNIKLFFKILELNFFKHWMFKSFIDAMFCHMQ